MASGGASDRDAVHDPRSPAPAEVGPCLYLRGFRAGRARLVALIASEESAATPTLETDEGPVTGRVIARCGGKRVLHYSFTLPAARDARYRVDGASYAVNTAFEDDLRIAYVSCNGQEFGDRGRRREERNALWARLGRQHKEAPFNLLLHGGDQIYADELVNAHPRAAAWAKGRAAALRLPSNEVGAVEQALRGAFFGRYIELLGQPEIGWLMARVPSLAMWDDHDICDGWGSLPEARLDSPIGQALFKVAREHFLMFQLGAAPNEPPAIMPDPSGPSLTWHAALPGLDIVAPDLRSERRRNRVMGPAGWAALDSILEGLGAGRVLVLSSVPALGPRLSWVEAVMHLTPKMEKYEDDLRDQWQSRAHRAEWRIFLERLAAVHANPVTPVTVLSGEIHLATRGTLDVPPAPLHQLVASGIAHPAPPKAYASVLGLLARFGETPLPEHPIRIHPLPGQPDIYTPERNYLVLERRQGRWHAVWELEHGGTTVPLRL